MVRLRLTDDAAARLEALSALHLQEIDRLSLDVAAAWEGLVPRHATHGAAAERSGVTGRRS